MINPSHIYMQSLHTNGFMQKLSSVLQSQKLFAYVCQVLYRTVHKTAGLCVCVCVSDPKSPSQPWKSMTLNEICAVFMC
jgi:hypothetical protein